MTKIRTATIHDLNLLVDLFENYRIFYEKQPDKEKAKEFLSERFKLNDSKVFVAQTANNILVGFVQLYPIFSSTRMKRLWLLNDLFVDKEFRGNGISKQLIETAKEFCKQTNACGLILETAKSNSVGNTLYPTMGFSLDSEHNFYTWDSN